MSQALMDAYIDRLAEMFGDLDACVAGLGQEALDWAPGPDMNSLAVLAVHVCGSTRYWVGDVGLGRPSRRDRDAEFRTRGVPEPELRARLAETLSWCREGVAGLTVQDLARDPGATRHDGPVTVAWALLHALEHAGLHAGHAQITRQLWDQRGVEADGETVGIP